MMTSPQDVEIQQSGAEKCVERINTVSKPLRHELILHRNVDASIYCIIRIIILYLNIALSVYCDIYTLHH